MLNRQWVLRQRPDGTRPLAACFELTEAPLAAIKSGEMLLRNVAFGIEPGMAAWMNNLAYYMAPLELGDPMRCWSVAEVVESNNPRFNVGERVHGVFDWQEYCVCGDIDNNNARLFTVPADASNATAAGLLWVSGITAYLGLMEYGKPLPGDTVLVSAAAGAVGSTVGQLAKLVGARVIGLAGSDEKCQWLIDELGFSGAINYKSANFAAELAAHCPQGINVYWDTVGGSQLDLVLQHMAVHGRIVQCGALSISTDFSNFKPLNNWITPLQKRLSWYGFIVVDHFEKFESTIARLHALERAGQLKVLVDTVYGFEHLPSALESLLSGQNYGKKVVLIAP